MSVTSRRQLGPVAGLAFSFALVLVLAGLMAPPAARAMPALLIGKSQTLPTIDEPSVIVVHDGKRMVLTQTAVLSGSGKSLSAGLAWLLPVPADVDQRNFNVGTMDLVRELERFTAARLIVARDESPCQGPATPVHRAPTGKDEGGDQRIGYTYVVGAPSAGAAAAGEGDYDVIVLTASESKRVSSWLAKQGFKLPASAKAAVAAATKARMRFAFARIKWTKPVAAGDDVALRLAPLQVAFEAKTAASAVPLTFGQGALPVGASVRLYLIGRDGRLDLAALPTVRFPTGETLPLAVKDDLTKVYEAILAKRGEARPRATLEYAGDLGLCEPCLDEPPSVTTLRRLGVFWLEGVAAAKKDVRRLRPAVADASGAVFVARWRLAYDAKSPLEVDPKIVPSGDKNEFQPRLAAALPHPDAFGSCEGAADYAAMVREREQRALTRLAELTGWDPRRLERTLGTPYAPERSWVDDLWR